MVLFSDISDVKLNDSQDIEKKNDRFHNQFNQEKLDKLLKEKDNQRKQKMLGHIIVWNLASKQEKIMDHY